MPSFHSPISFSWCTSHFFYHAAKSISSVSVMVLSFFLILSSPLPSPSSTLSLACVCNFTVTLLHFNPFNQPTLYSLYCSERLIRRLFFLFVWKCLLFTCLFVCLFVLLLLGCLGKVRQGVTVDEALPISVCTVLDRKISGWPLSIHEVLKALYIFKRERDTEWPTKLEAGPHR